MALLQGCQLAIPDLTLPELFHNLIKEGQGFKTSVIHNGKEYCYSALDNMSNNIAYMLTTLFNNENIQEAQVIAILIPPSIQRIASMLALLKLGCAILPLDQVQPQARMKSAIDDAKVKFLLTTKEHIESCTSFLKEVSVLNVSDISTGSNTPNFVIPYTFPANPLVGVYFTSGSTGKPNGVKLDTNNILNRLYWYWQEFPFQPIDVGCHKTSILFVDSLTEILSCLFQGVPLVIMDQTVVKNVEKLLEEIQRLNVTRLVLVPSLLRAMLAISHTKTLWKPFQSLRQIICSGEALQPELGKEALRELPAGCILCNFYGSTETTGDATFEIFKDISEVQRLTCNGVLSIGKPIAHSQIYVLGEDKKPVKGGNVGEIYISGRCITPGLINTTDKEGFLKLESGNILYQTKDLGFILNDRLYYQGRNDTQVKVRGHRVDLLEIQRSIEEMEIIENVVVLACMNKITSSLIPVAFCTMKELFVKKKEDFAVAIHDHCKTYLAEYMLPHICILEKMLMQQHTGKIDRQALKKMYEVEHSMDRSHTDDAILIIAETLGVPLERVQNGGNFFALGGNSLSAVVAVANLNKSGIPVSLTAFLQAEDICTVHDRKEKGFELEEYEIEMITSDVQDEVSELLATEFTTQNPLDIIAGTTKEDFKILLNSFYSEILEDNLSFIVRNRSTMDIEACTIVLDASTEINPVFIKTEVAEINNAVEEPVKCRLLQEGGKWMDALLNAVHHKVPEEKKMCLLSKMEDYILDLAKKKAFDGIVTVNSHPVTMMLAETQYGYTVENILHVKSFVYKGQQPFINAKKDYCIKCMTKRL